MQSDERSHHVRFPLGVTVSFGNMNNSSFDLSSHDLSVAGILLRGADAERGRLGPEGEKVRCTIELPFDDGVIERLSVDSEVAHVLPGVSVGLRFKWRQDREDGRTILEKYLEQFRRRFEYTQHGPEPVYENVVSGYLTFRSNAPFRMENGGVLPGLVIAYETWGQLNREKSNAVLLHTGLSASSHARSHSQNPRPGWWESFIGPGLPLDTDRFYVICSNVLGGCYGSTGPCSHNPDTGRPWATDFPLVTIQDMVRAQLLLLDDLGIDRLHGCVGSSMGAMQSLALAATAPERVGRMVSISVGAHSPPTSIALRFAQRSALMNDPDWNNGHYYGRAFPFRGMRVARQIGVITYRSGREWNERFGRRHIRGKPTLGVDFEIEGYLTYHGEKFSLQYDPNSYLYLSKAMDLFDVRDVLEAGPAGAPRGVRCPSLIIGVSSDLLYPVATQREVAELVRRGGASTRYLELDSIYGHDSFLILVDEFGRPIKAHLEAEGS